MRPILSVEGLNKSFGGIIATNNIHLQIEQGEIHAIIGPNGAGKTTLISQLSGDLNPDKGEIFFNGHSISNMPSNKRSLLGIARTFQITCLMLDMSVLDNVTLAVQAQNGHSYRFWSDARHNNQVIQTASKALEQVGLLDRENAKASDLSHGEHRQLEIAVALATQPKLLLLDEPMAGMNVEEKREMCRFILETNDQYGTTIVLIEHDMGVVMDISDRVVVLDYGKIIGDGVPEEVRSSKAVIDAYLGVA